MEDGGCVLAPVFLKISVRGSGERAVGTGDVVPPCRRRSESLDRFDALDHRGNIEWSVEHVGIDKRRDERIRGLNCDRTA